MQRKDTVRRHLPSRGALIRLVVFAGLPLLSAASPILVIPSLTAALGAPGWGAIAVGQSVGTFGALLVSFGWAIEGSSRAAASDAADRRQLYRDSVGSRSITAAAALPAVVLIACLVPTTHPSDAAVMALATALSGALPTWYFIGTGQPVLLALFDTVPRVLAAVVAAVVLPFVPEGWVYPTILLSFTLISAVLAVRTIAGTFLAPPTRQHARQLRRNVLIVLSSAVSSGYGSLSLTLVTVASPLATIDYAAGTRVLALGTSFAGSLSNAVQSWVSSPVLSQSHLMKRRRTALLGSSCAGGVAAIGLYIAFPAVASVLFSDRIQLSSAAQAFVCACLWLIVIGMSASFHVLIPSATTRTVAISGIVTTCVGVPLLLIGAAFGNAEGALLGLMCTEIVSTSIQLGACVKLFVVHARAAGSAGGSLPEPA